MNFEEILNDYVYNYNHSDRNEIIKLEDSIYEAHLIYSDEEIEGYLGTGSVIVLKFLDVYDATEELGEPGISFIEEFVSCNAPALSIDENAWSPNISASLYEEVARYTYECINNIFKNAYLGEVSYLSVS